MTDSNTRAAPGEDAIRIMTHLPGVPMWKALDSLPADGQLDLIRQLGAVTGRIHAMDCAPDSLPDELVRWGSLSECIEEDLATLTEQKRITPRARKNVEELLAAHSSLLAAMDNEVVMLQGDIAFRNTLVEEIGGEWRVTGLVDGELIGCGSRGRELRVLEPLDFRPMALPGIRDAFLAGYGPGLSREGYSLAYLVAELCPSYPNEPLLARLDSAQTPADLETLGMVW